MSSLRPADRYDAIVPAGGAASRFGSDKTIATVGDVTLLDRVLDALEGAGTVVVVGEPRPTSRQVTWRREQPIGGGPAAAVATGLKAVSADVVVLLAADLPFMTPGIVDALIADMSGTGAVLVDENGREQWLASAWRTDTLRDAHLVSGGSLGGTLSRLQPVTVSAEPRAIFDCDTVEQWEVARGWV